MELLACPACGAPASVPVGSAVATCGHCGARYRMVQGHALEVPAQGNAARNLAGMAVLGAVIVVGVVVAAFVLRPPKVVPLPTDGDEPVTVNTAVDALDPAAQASGTFTFHHLRKNADGSLSLYGEAKNTSATIINKPEIIAVFRDAKGKELRAASGYAERDFLLPGTTSPVQVRVADPPAYTDLAYEVVVQKASYVPVFVAGLDVTSEPPRTDTLGMIEFTGKVRNGGDKVARYVHVEVLALDAQDHILGIESTYAKADLLRPGEEARFRVLGLKIPEPVARYSLSATGRSAE